MICKKCGGNLLYTNKIYVCQSCGVNISLADYYEDIDTFICYVETDAAGRRTKDSVVAQEIYHKLENKKIKTFYSRISVSNLSEDDLQMAAYAAITAAKTIIILGSTEDHFKSLLSTYGDFCADKITIPIYFEIDAYSIPKDISAVQALNYNKIGADTDLVKALLNALGREEEITFSELTQKSNSKKRLFLFAFSAVIVLVSIAYLVFGTNLIFPSNSSTSQNEASTEDTNESLYNAALAHIEDGEYEKAIENLSHLQGYKDSDRQLQLLYGKYIGYFQTEDSSLTLHLTISNSSNANVEITKRDTSGRSVRIIESAVISGNLLEFDFTDSQSNIGKGKLSLKSNAIVFQSTVEQSNDELSIGNLDATFYLVDRSDKPFAMEITKSMLIDWLTGTVTIDDIKQMGIDVVFVESPSVGGIPNEYAAIYSIKNTDIQLLALGYDTTNLSDWNEVENHKLKKQTIFAITAPAEILLPDKVGAKALSCVVDDVLYVPYGELATDVVYGDMINGKPYFMLYYGETMYTDESFRYKNFSPAIAANTQIGITSKKALGIIDFNKLTDYQKDESLKALAVEEYRATHHICEHPGRTCGIFSYVRNREEQYYVISVEDNDGMVVFYQINIGNGEIKELNDYSGFGDF